MPNPPLPGRRRLLTTLLGGAAALAGIPAGARSTKQRQILIQRSPLAGFQYHDGEALWQQLTKGDALTLVREPDNRFDAHAVRIDWRGHKLGYVPRADNAAVAQMLDRGERLEAFISGLYDDPNPWRRICLEIRIAA